mgnify:FL=1
MPQTFALVPFARAVPLRRVALTRCARLLQSRTCARRRRTASAAIAAMARAALRLVELPRWPIKRMLRLEEALVRHEPGNWCLVTALPPQQPTVVVGLGGKPERLLDASELKKRPVSVR